MRKLRIEIDEVVVSCLKQETNEKTASKAMEKFLGMYDNLRQDLGHAKNELERAKDEIEELTHFKAQAIAIENSRKKLYNY